MRSSGGPETSDEIERRSFPPAAADVTLPVYRGISFPTSRPETGAMRFGFISQIIPRPSHPEGRSRRGSGTERAKVVASICEPP